MRGALNSLGFRSASNPHAQSFGTTPTRPPIDMLWNTPH
jgi:hypothetical protein